MNKDWIVRALKTFWQAALSALLLNAEQIVHLIPQGWDVTKPVLISVATGALAAGFSALYNGLIKPQLTSNIEGED